MIPFTKSSLRYSYSWTFAKKNDNARIVGFPDYYFLYRGEGFEVLPFINRYMKSRAFETVKAFQKVEEIIQNGLSKSIASHFQIKAWLDNNLNLA